MTVAQAGGEVGCKCGKQLAVPTLRGIRQLEPTIELVATTAPRWSRTHGIIFASGMICVCIGLGILAYHGLYYLQLDDYAVDQTGDVVKEYTGQLDKITAPEALDLWRTEILGEGLGERQDPPWVAVQARLREHLRWIQLGAVSLGLGTLMAIGAIAIGRRR